MDPIILKKLNEIIFYYIHEAPRLRRLFIRWSYLELADRMQIDEIMQVGLQEKQNQLYISLRDALEAWEHLQDTQGAPGFQSGSVQCACAKGIENDLTCIMTLLENCLDKIYEQKYTTPQRCTTSIIEVDNDDDVHEETYSPMLLGNETATRLLTFNKYKKSTSDSKSDSRISRGITSGVFIKTGGDSSSTTTHQRARSTSGSRRVHYNKSNDLQTINSDWLKFSSNGYRSE